MNDEDCYELIAPVGGGGEIRCDLSKGHEGPHKSNVAWVSKEELRDTYPAAAPPLVTAEQAHGFDRQNLVMGVHCLCGEWFKSALVFNEHVASFLLAQQQARHEEPHDRECNCICCDRKDRAVVACTMNWAELFEKAGGKVFGMQVTNPRAESAESRFRARTEQLDALLASHTNLRARLCEAEQQREEATKWAICSYCGEKMPKYFDREEYATALTEHMEHCPTHPFNQWHKAEADAADLRGLLREVWERASIHQHAATCHAYDMNPPRPCDCGLTTLRQRIQQALAPPVPRKTIE